jgi:O-antigen/teichoic acid export membrane protein
MALSKLAFLQWLSFRGGGLRAEVVRSTIWLAMGNGSAKVVNLLKIAILGRLLAPDDFGLMAIAILTLKWLEFFSETGFNKALVQHQGDIESLLDTAWLVQLARGVVLAILLFIMAPMIAYFFSVPEATAIIQASSVILIIRGLANPAMVYLRRDLDFKRIFWWTFSNAAVGLVVAVCAALLYRNVWALMTSVLAATIASTILSYVIKPYRPRLQFHWPHVETLMQFGKWIFFLTVVSFVGLYADSAMVGKLLGMTDRFSRFLSSNRKSPRVN